MASYTRLKDVRATGEVKALVELTDGRIIEAQFMAEGIVHDYVEEDDYTENGVISFVEAEVEEVEPLFADDYLEDDILNESDITIKRVIEVLDTVTEWDFEF